MNDRRVVSGKVRLWGALLLLLFTGCGIAPAGFEDGGPGGDLATAEQAATSHTVSSSWTCPAGTTCDDIYEFNVPANTRVTIVLTSASAIHRLAVFGPNSLSTDNLLTNSRSDWNCSTTAPEVVSFTTTTSGTYQFVVGRDKATSGTTGTYTVSFQGNPSMTFVRQSANDVPNTRGRTCGWTQLRAASFACSVAGRSCQNVFDFDVPAETILSLNVSGFPSGADLSMALWAPGISVDGVNLLRNTRANRTCVGRGATEQTRILLRNAGRYRFGVAYESNLSQAGLTSGSYVTTVGSTQPLVARGQTTTNGALATSDVPACPWFQETHEFMSCGANLPCQEVYDFFQATPAIVTMELRHIIAGRARMALFQSSSLSDRNHLNMLFSDRQCMASGVQDVDTTNIAVSNRFRVAFGRDADASGGGSYLGGVRSNEPLTPFGQTVNDGAPRLTTTSCP